MDNVKYVIKCCEKQEELSRMGLNTDAEILTYVLYGINPYSIYWRIGVIRALRHAIRLLEKEEKEKSL